MSGMNNRKSVILGLFILFGIAIVVVGVLTLGGQKKSFVKSVHINSVFDDVNGLSVGNNIWFNGVKVGTIKSIGFNQAADVMVEMSIEEKVMKYIASDAKVKIGSDGLIGNKIIVIYGGSAGAPRVAANGTLKVETALSTEELMGTLQENNKNLLAITSDFKAISSKLASGQGSIGKLLTDESLYNDLRTTMTGLKRASDNASHLTNDLSGFTAKLNEKGTLANELVTDTTVFASLRSTVAQINEAARKANDVVANFSKASSQLNNAKSPVGTLLYDEAAAGDLKLTLHNLQQGSAKLDENMEALQHNFLLRGFFRRKAKAEKNAAKQ